MGQGFLGSAKKPGGSLAKPRSDSAPVPYALELRLFSRGEGTFRKILRGGVTDVEMYPLGKKWAYIVQNRMRLAGEVARSSHKELERMILDYFSAEDESLIEELSRAEIVEVSIPFETEDVGWAARLFPWEDALTLVTRRLRKHQLCRNLFQTFLRRLEGFGLGFAGRFPERARGDDGSGPAVSHHRDAVDGFVGPAAGPALRDQ